MAALRRHALVLRREQEGSKAETYMPLLVIGKGQQIYTGHAIILPQNAVKTGVIGALRVSWHYNVFCNSVFGDRCVCLNTTVVSEAGICRLWY